MKALKWGYAHAEEVLLSIFLTAIVLISGVQVVARYAFNNSLTWSEELCRYLYVWSGFMTVSYCIRSGSIIKIDTVVMFLPKVVQKILDVITSIISFAIVGLLFKSSLGVVGNVIATGQLTSAMQIPIWIVYLCAPVGYCFIEIRLVEHLIRIFRGNKKSEEADA